MGYFEVETLESWLVGCDGVKRNMLMLAVGTIMFVPTLTVVGTRLFGTPVMEKDKPKRPEPLLKAIFIEYFGHFCIAHMCWNVMFDLLVLTPPLYLIRPFSLSWFQWCMTQMISWTTPVVLSASFSWSGMRVFINDKDLMESAKTEPLLALANHGSRVDWLIGMYIGYCGNSIRVGFLCEWLIKYIPLIGWYRNWVCEDLFLVRSFKQDKDYIIRRLQEFKENCIKLLIVLAPEGVIVDQGEGAMMYIKACNDFCQSLGFPAFEYVLTPRYKGMTCLQEHVKHGGRILSTTMTFRQSGRLLNEKLKSPARVVPDLYSTFEGVGGDTTRVDVYIRPMNNFDNPDQLKSALMNDYLFKDTLIRSMHEKDEFPGVKPEDMHEYEVPHLALNVVTFFHNVAWMVFALAMNVWWDALLGAATMFTLVCLCTTFGKTMTGTTMESIPFETGIKAVMMWSYNRKLKKAKSDPRIAKAASTSQTAY